eukprot:m.11209 g.11209  ORF g.11209 m.11209 type:complete len:485 (+) comp23086_c1_seq1:14-1468(+)
MEMSVERIGGSSRERKRPRSTHYLARMASQPFPTLAPPPPSGKRRTANPSAITNPFVDVSSPPAFPVQSDPFQAPEGDLLGSHVQAVPAAVTAKNPGDADWSIFDELESKTPDQIDLEIEQMEQDLAKLNAMAVEYEQLEADPVTQGLAAAPNRLINEVPQSPMGEGIYDIPTLPPPPPVDKTRAQAQPASSDFPTGDLLGGAPAQAQPAVTREKSWLEFESPFPIGSGSAQSFTTFPPQAPPAATRQPTPTAAAGGSATAERKASAPLTHRAIHNFIPRHDEEIELRKGDPVHMSVDGGDGWFKGTNLRTGGKGIFPGSNVMGKADPGLKAALGISGPEKFIVRFIGTVPLKKGKGIKYVTGAIEKVHSARLSACPPPTGVTVMQVNTQGIKIFNTNQGKIDSTKRPKSFPLQNITYVASHPKNKRYFGFIFQIPSREGVYACYVFASASSTVPICEAIGRSFKKLKESFLNYSNPTKDYYIE